jgi:hypothetical protein
LRYCIWNFPVAVFHLPDRMEAEIKNLQEFLIGTGSFPVPDIVLTDRGKHR